MNARFPFAAALGACLATAGCDYDKQLEECAKHELCVLKDSDAPKPMLRFPHNGFGLGSESATTTQLAWGPKRPYLTWEFNGDDSWHFRVQLNKCAPGQSLAQCPFPPNAISSGKPDTAATSYQWEQDLVIGSRYWWRVRACTTAGLGFPCGQWSDPRYFDVGRPEPLPNDLAGNGLGALAVAQAAPLNGGTTDKVYLYLGNNTGPTPWIGRPTLDVGPPGVAVLDYTAIPAGAGDLNGDGFSDLAVGYRIGGGATAQMLPVHVYLSTAAGPGATVIELGPSPELFGQALGRAGDVNGDGVSDLAVCQPGNKRVLVYFGKSGGPANVSNGDAQLELTDATGPGCAFAALADVDADGNDDIAVSAPGQIRIFHGHPGPGAWVDAFDVSPANAGFGASMAGGDFNGDGHGDLVVEGNDGKAYLYLGSPLWFGGGFPPAIPFTVEPGLIVPAGDLNNDGFADLAIGGRGTGQVRLYLGRATGAPGPGPTLTDSLPGFGTTFAGVGDVTNDSFDDLLVGGTNGAILFRGVASDNDLGTLTNVLLPPAGSENFGAGAASGY
ncbi:MAG TPA: VCBS repeat-containing protein [Myxococcaceae bacterium]|jgi:hypothetical protein